MNYKILFVFGTIFLCAADESQTEEKGIHKNVSRVIQQEVRYPLPLLREIEGTFHFLPDGQRGILEKDGHSQLWDIRSWSPIRDLPSNVSQISNIMIKENSIIALSYKNSNTIQVLNVLTGKIFKIYSYNKFLNSPKFFYKL